MMTDQDLVTVLVPEEPAQLALVEALLREHDIPYVARNERLQNLFGAGEIGAYNFAIGPVALQVSGADLERTRELLSEALGEEALQSVELGREEKAPDLHSPLEKQVLRYSRFSMALGAFWFGGLGSLLAIYFSLRALSLGRRTPDLSLRQAKSGLALGVAGVLLWLFLWGSPYLG